MALTKLLATLNKISTLATTIRDQAATVKDAFDHDVNEVKDYINDTLTAEIDTLDAANAKKTGDQTIDGIKTFTSSPIVPAPTANMEASTKQYVDDMGTDKSNDLNTHKDSSDHDERYFTETELGSTTDSSSGADKIGLTPVADITATTVQGFAEGVRVLIEEIEEVNANAEVVIARKGETTLGAKIDIIDSSLAEKANQDDGISFIPYALSKLDKGENVLGIFCGDSVTQGGHFGMSMTDTYTGQLCSLIAAKYPNLKVIFVSGAAPTENTFITAWTETVIQEGAGGQTLTLVKSGVSGDTCLRLDARLQNLYQYNGVNADFIFLMCGINDSLIGIATRYMPYNIFEKAYNSLIKMIKDNNKNADIVLCAPHWFGNGTGALYNDMVNYGDAVKNVAFYNSCGFIDTRVPFIANYSPSKNSACGYNDPLLGDTWHPTVQGHSVIASLIYSYAFKYNRSNVVNQTDQNVYINHDNKNCTYSGTWVNNAISNSAGVVFEEKVSNAIDAYVSTNFVGSKIYLLGRKLVDGATIECYIDDVLAKTIIMNNPYPTDHSLFYNTDLGTIPKEKILIAENLSDTVHTLKIIIKTNKYFAFDGVLVENSKDIIMQHKNAIMDYGTINIAGTGGTFASTNITLKKTMAKPIIVANASSLNYYCAVTLLNGDGTTTIYITRRDGATFTETVAVSWIAIG